jgi:DNA phosphorothioation-associated putative methyltransferase
LDFTPGSCGKRVVDDFYIHLSATDLLPDVNHRVHINRALLVLGALHVGLPNVAKLNLRTGKLSLLSYPSFDEHPFPELVSSWTFSEIGAGEPTFRSYENSINRPILHRKELLVLRDHPRYGEWCELTAVAESLGLFDDTSTIGFRLNWERLVRSKGYSMSGNGFVPIGNANPVDASVGSTAGGQFGVQRHLTALTRSSLSAPIQFLIRHRLLTPETSLFDYGCGRADDLNSLNREGFTAAGWDPHYAPSNPRLAADVVNLGFVVNVIEDPAERVDAIHQAFALARGVLAVSVMLHGAAPCGTSFRDGVLTSRNTFQKYFSQGELKDFLEHVLNRTVYMAGPGVAFIFASYEWEQRYSTGRFQSRGIAQRLLMARLVRPREPKPPKVRQPKVPTPSRAETRLAESKPFLDKFWALTLELGRWPEVSETQALGSFPERCSSVLVARRLIEKNYDLTLLAVAASTRTDDLRVFFAAQQFEKRPAFKQLSNRLQIDIKAFFGDCRSAQAAGLTLLEQTSDPDRLLVDAKKAFEQGLGWLDGTHSLQLHVDLIERLPAVLRAYVTCGLVLWDSIGEVDLVKIHLESGKLTLLEYDEFDAHPLPTLKRRVKVNLRKIDYDVFEYGSALYPKPLLYQKSRYMHEDQEGFVEQHAFDEALNSAGLLRFQRHEPTATEFARAIYLARRDIKGMRLVRSNVIPDLDQACGSNFTYRDLVECGETQGKLGLTNLPKRPQTYNSLHDLSVRILDPVIEYFGAIKLTYGFCSPELSKHIRKRVAHHLDQHAAWELDENNKLICSRGGASCDFLVEDEDMGQVADWIIQNLPFDRLYYYGPSRPLHVSGSERPEHKAYRMAVSAAGRLMPARYTPAQSGSPLGGYP